MKHNVTQNPSLFSIIFEQQEQKPTVAMRDVEEAFNVLVDILTTKGYELGEVDKRKHVLGNNSYVAKISGDLNSHENDGKKISFLVRTMFPAEQQNPELLDKDMRVIISLKSGNNQAGTSVQEFISKEDMMNDLEQLVNNIMRSEEEVAVAAPDLNLVLASISISMHQKKPRKLISNSFDDPRELLKKKQNIVKKSKTSYSVGDVLEFTTAKGFTFSVKITVLYDMSTGFSGELAIIPPYFISSETEMEQKQKWDRAIEAIRKELNGNLKLTTKENIFDWQAFLEEATNAVMTFWKVIDNVLLKEYRL